MQTDEEIEDIIAQIKQDDMNKPEDEV